MERQESIREVQEVPTEQAKETQEGRSFSYGKNFSFYARRFKSVCSFCGGYTIIGIR